MIIRAAVRAAGRVGQRVLVAGLFRDPGIQLLHRPAFQTIVDVAARVVIVLGKPFESPVKASAAHANTVDRDVVAKALLLRYIVIVTSPFLPVSTSPNH